MSFLIFEQMLSKHLNLKSALDKFLNEADYEFIRELINPPSNFVIIVK